MLIYFRIERYPAWLCNVAVLLLTDVSISFCERSPEAVKWKELSSYPGVVDIDTQDQSQTLRQPPDRQVSKRQYTTFSTTKRLPRADLILPTTTSANAEMYIPSPSPSPFPPPTITISNSIHPLPLPFRPLSHSKPPSPPTRLRRLLIPLHLLRNLHTHIKELGHTPIKTDGFSFVEIPFAVFWRDAFEVAGLVEAVDGWNGWMDISGVRKVEVDGRGGGDGMGWDGMGGNEEGMGWDEEGNEKVMGKKERGDAWY